MWRALAAGVIAILAAPMAMAKSGITDFTLENGMQVVVIEDHRAPVVVQMVWYRAGSADETPGVSGVAHFLEHLLFKGTKTLAPGEFSATVAAHGGSDNAFTSYDYTAYFQRVAADRLELMMRMESDRMVNLQLGEEEILTERDVIIEERNQRTETSPSALLREQMRAAQFMNHRYGVPIIGWRHEMERLSLADALAYYREFYAPNNAILVVAGDVNPDEVRALAQTYYGALPANPDLAPRLRPQEPPQTAMRHLIMEDPRVAQPMVMRSYLAPERDPGDQKQAAALTLLAALLGDGQTSFLTQRLQFERKTATYASAYYSGVSVDDTQFNFILAPAHGVSLEEAEAELDAAIAAFMETGVDEAHLARLKTQLRASEIYERDNVEARANRYGRGLATGLALADIEAWPDIIHATTAQEIMAAARAVLDRKTSVSAWLRAPKEEGAE